MFDGIVIAYVVVGDTPGWLQQGLNADNFILRCNTV
jgi:hypothetical protein